MAPHIAAALHTATTADLLDVPMVSCETCNGIGHGYSDNGPAPRAVTCWDCEGAGSWEGEFRCPQCDHVLEMQTDMCPACREVVKGYAA